MASVIEEFLVKFDFDAKTTGLDRVVSGMKAFGSVGNAVKAPFEAFIGGVNAITMAFKFLADGIGYIEHLSTEAALAADKLQEMSSEMGVATEEMEFFGFAAEQSGTDAGSMHFALRMLNSEIANAANGSKEAQEGFTKLGISIKDGSGNVKSAGDVMQEAVVALSLIPDQGKRAATAIEIFGRSGIALTNFLKQSPEQLAELRAEFYAFGGATSTVLMQLGNDYDNSLKKQRTAINSFKQAFALGLQPTINAFAKWTENMYREHGPALRRAFETLGKAIGEVFHFFEGIFTRAAAIWADVATDFVNYAKPILVILALLNAGAIATGLAFAASWAAAFAPLIAGYLLVEDFFAFLEDRPSVIGDIVEAWDGWIASIQEAHPFIAAVMTGIGEMLGAIGIAIKVLFRAWNDDGFMAMWNILREFSPWFTNIVEGWLGLYSTLWGWIQKVGEGIAWVFGKVRGITGANEYLNQAPGVSALAPSSSTTLFGGVSPFAPPSAGGQSVSTNTNNMSIAVNAAPGMDERALASMVGQRVQEVLMSEYRATQPDVAGR